ncbi:MAG: dihydroorotate dehydrogenase-like protein [Proteobacteria bacterium]|nr:dihydroorotate dehydrogenase-like protein [Pseudomonadota bacterium]
MNMQTTYLGMQLKNPLVPSSSPLSKDIDSAKKLEDAGAAALVMNSLFEEEIRMEDEMLDDFFKHLVKTTDIAGDRVLPDIMCTAIDDYLMHLIRLKTTLDIPVIASLNADTLSAWVGHVSEIEESGADALELNVYHIPTRIEESSADVEALYIDTLTTIKEKLTIPVVMKLPSQFSSVPNMVYRLQQAGADGVSLFNRFYQPSIDLDSLDVMPQIRLSTSYESLLSMRWIAFLRDQVKLTLAATSGAHTVEDALRLLLTGADVVHMCSALLKNGPEHLSEVLKGMQQWMEEKGYDSLSQFQGSVSHAQAANPAAYARANYLQLLKNW